jgi:hypothetical protein
MFYLYLTTHDPTGALLMNELLWKAQLQEHELRWRLRDAKTQPAAQMRMFDMPVPEPQVEPRPSTDEIATTITQRLKGRTLTRRDLYREFADEPYYATEIDKALTQLKKNGVAQYATPLNNNTIITIK